MLNLLRRLADNRRRGSFANRMRQRRFRLFRALIEGLLKDRSGGSLMEVNERQSEVFIEESQEKLKEKSSEKINYGSQPNISGLSLKKEVRRPPEALHREASRPLKVIDIGGTEDFWRQMGITGDEGLEVTLLNLVAVKVELQGFASLAGDARDLSRFPDKAFDVAFSNSVIEHLGEWPDQQAMAGEMRRVGKHIFLQTPNKHFPLEPHFLFPFFQFLPVGWRIWLLMRFSPGWYPRHTDRESARQAVASIRLLTRKELKTLFPGATIVRERFMGLTKSFVVIG